MDDFEVIQARVWRRKQILDQGCPLADLDEYNVLTLKMAESVPSLLRAVQDVIALRDELNSPPDGPAAIVSKAFGQEIDRALKGQR